MKKQLFNLKNIALVCATALLSLGTFAQMQVGNSGFENWDELGNNKERPVNWNNMKNGDLCTLCGFGSMQTTWRDTDTRPSSTGTYSARIKSGSAMSNIINGNMTLGKLHAPSTTPSQGYNETTRSDAQFSEVMTDKPDSIVFWAKYSITNSDDSARVSATIHDDYDYRDPQNSNSAPHAVAKAVRNFQTNGNWVRMSVPFEYSGPSTDAQYILISFASSYEPGSGKDGATLFIDDMELIYNPNQLDISPIADQNLFVNETGNTLTATEVPNASSAVTSRQWKSATTSGGSYSDIIGETGSTYTPQFANAGTYYVVCETNFQGDIVTSNEVKIVVDELTVSIAPTAVQNLVENQPGTTLTATENTVADSRQWKYATTAGGPYSTDITGETGTTYSPQFASAGTYYVVCESTLFGHSVTSNEVEVNVTVAVGNDVVVAPNTVQNLVENEMGTDLTATETPNTANTREWQYTTTSGSGYTSFSPAETGATYTPQFANAGTYYVVCVSDFGGGDIVTSNEVEINVVEFTVSIDPASDQNLEENEAGTTLTVTESPTVDSREWLSSTTSGSGYTSFSPAETGTTYTPQFANAGTYYVVCESTINGVTVTSNEVVIVVTPFVGIDKNTKPSFNVYAKDQHINVDFSNVEMENATMKIHNINGKMVAQHALESNTMNSIQIAVPTGIYFFSIGNGKSFYQGKIFIR